MRRRRRDGAADEFGGQRGRRVAAGDGEGEREVRGVEDGDGAERDGTLANVEAWQWGSIGGGAGRWCGRPRR